jgi:hypothetical protein
VHMHAPSSIMACTSSLTVYYIQSRHDTAFHRLVDNTFAIQQAQKDADVYATCQRSVNTIDCANCELAKKIKGTEYHACVNSMANATLIAAL